MSLTLLITTWLFITRAIIDLIRKRPLPSLSWWIGAIILAILSIATLPKGP